MKFSRGDIVVADFPFTAMTDFKKRPCVVLAQSDTPDDYIVAFISSSSDARSLPSAVSVLPTHKEWDKTGLRAACVIRPDKLMTLHTSLIAGKIGNLPEDRIAELKEKLAGLLL
ncbi:MAG: type II toxin-antitoxin system PemK/MazF family toxin [Chloroherpetonaceae bacterium]